MYQVARSRRESFFVYLLIFGVFTLSTGLAPGIPLAGIVPGDYAEPYVDTLYASLVKEYTTDERFLPPVVAQLPDHPTILSPREFLGYIAGAPNRLTYYAEIKTYLETLAAASNRVQLRSAGKSNEGREMIVLFIGDEDVLKKLDWYAGQTRRLADPRVTSEEAANEIFQNALPFYYLSGGLHSAETGSPEMLMELAYRLAVGESPLVQRIRKNVITMITPVLETDGRERMVDWYYKVTIDHTDWENMPPRTPPYWGKYIYHDNNRDGIQLSQPLTRNLFDIFFQYHPQVMHDLHESIPLLYISSGTGPYNDALDPIVTSEWHWIANHEVTELIKLGMPGVWTWGFYTGWWPGYLLWLANNHNSIGRFYETFGNAGASTFDRELKGKFADKEITTKQWYRPWPPDKKTKWSFRDNINYMETGVLVALDFAAQNNKSFLYNFWKKGYNSWKRGSTTPPYAWILPLEGQNKYELSYLINNLRDQRVEVHVLEENVELGEQRYQKGSFLIRMDQPYRDYAKSLMEPQRFPAGTEHRPYDDVAWTLPLLYGVTAHRIDDKSIFEKNCMKITDPVSLSGAFPRKKNRNYVIPASSSGKFLEARILLEDFEVFAADTSFEADDMKCARGSWVIPAGEAEGLYEKLEIVAQKLGLDVLGARSVPEVPKHELDMPRIAVFHTWTYTQDSGWVRYTFDRAGIPYTLIDKDDLREGYLRRRYDVILLPDLGRWFKPKQLVHGIDTKWSPLPYKRTSEFHNLGVIDQTADMTGGMGFAGLSNLEDFVDDGGTLISLGAGSLIPVELGLIRNVDRIRPPGFFCPGSVVRAKVVDSANPIVYGYEEITHVFRGASPLFDVSRNYRHYTVLQYGTKSIHDSGSEPVAGPYSSNNEAANNENTRPGDESICLSGVVEGEKDLDGKPAVLSIDRGKGRIIVFSFNPLHRYLTLSDFGLVYNAILHWND